MAYTDYIAAVKLGKKDYQSRLLHHQLPTLEVLDNILQSNKIYKEVSLGLIQIPLDRVVGTKTSARSNSFSSNFMPILEEGTEFSNKWINLSIAQETEGIHDPIRAYEYMNKFYVLEGNKRVSVLKYYGAVSIMAEVTRIIPPKSDDKQVKLYYEFMDFYELSKINYIEFSSLGHYGELQRLVGKKPGEVWTDEDRKSFNSLFSIFKTDYMENGGQKLTHITEGDAFLAFIKIYGYKDLQNKTYSELKDLIVACFNEIELLDKKDIELRVTANSKKPFLSKLLPTSSPKLKVAFIYPKSPTTTSWVYSHELGRLHLEQSFSNEVTTMSYENINEVTIDETIEKAIGEGCNIIFTTSPAFSQASVKAAISHPKVNILNCSLHSPHSNIRTYYTRMHEAKFIMGAIAGAMTENDKIMYIADYPIYGTIANINSFALGVKTVNPRAKIYLEWTSLKHINIEQQIKNIGVDCVSDKDLSIPGQGTRNYGLYRLYDDGMWSLAIPLYHWGNFYSQLIRDIMNGSFKAEDSKSKSINYWWGMSEHVLEIITTKWLPEGIHRLIKLLSNTISSGDFNPFSGTIYSQDGTVVNKEDHVLSPTDIITMDWLSDNIVGEIPSLEQLQENAKPVTIEQGLKPEKEI